MLVRFSFNNWMSFRDDSGFSMVASRERQHGDRIPKVSKYRMRLLPVAAIYGGNASGKTNFFKALHFVKSFIERGTLPERLITVEPFRLDKNYLGKPTHFCIEILVDETIFEYSFSVTRQAVVEEKLVEIRSSSEIVLFHRKDRKIELNAKYSKDDFLYYVHKGTRDNQLFLTNSIMQQSDAFKPIYNWFKNNLVLLAPDSRFEPFEQFIQEEHPLFDVFNRLLFQLDTGILHLGGEDIAIDNLPLPEPVRTQLKEDIKEGITVRVRAEPRNERFIVSLKDGELIAKKLVAYHQHDDGEKVRFDMQHESDGTLRVIDLVPAFLDVSSQFSKKVYVIDELDRSLHSLLTKNLINSYLDNCSSKSRTQLLFTTHDVLLMDQDIFRRDEMWITERNRNGVSSLFSFSEYKDVRYDKDIRRSYLQGRLGGIPNIVLKSGFDCADILVEKV